MFTPHKKREFGAGRLTEDQSNLVRERLDLIGLPRRSGRSGLDDGECRIHGDLGNATPGQASRALKLKERCVDECTRGRTQSFFQSRPPQLSHREAERLAVNSLSPFEPALTLPIMACPRR
jgi:hypothetical protein